MTYLIILIRYFFEYLWRDHVKRKNGDHFTSFLTLLAARKNKLHKRRRSQRSIMSFLFYFSFPVLHRDGDPLWDCVFCGCEHTKKEDMRKHEQKDCPTRPEWEFSCLYCGLEFPSKTGLSIQRWNWSKKIKIYNI